MKYQVQSEYIKWPSLGRKTVDFKKALKSRGSQISYFGRESQANELIKHLSESEPSEWIPNFETYLFFNEWAIGFYSV